MTYNVLEDSSEYKNNRLSRNSSSKQVNENKYFKNLDCLAKNLLGKINKQSN